MIQRSALDAKKETEAGQRTLTIALAGQPNVGKSTVFNMLTGLNQHVGNWPGKTIEQRTGILEHHGVRIHLVDLPGTYSLTAGSPEELIAREFIITERPDVVMVVLNAASLERNLYLVSELLMLPSPIVIGLNMVDVAKQEGYEVDAKALSEALGVPVVPMTASRGQGVHEFLNAALEVALHGPAREPARPQVREDHRHVLERVQAIIADYVPSPYPPEWVPIKLLEGDREITAMMERSLPAERLAELRSVLHGHEDAILAVAGGRYQWIRKMTQAALKRPRPGQVTYTQRLDAVATHPFWGAALLVVVLAGVFALTYSFGAPLQEFLATTVIGAAAHAISEMLAGAPTWITGLLVEGVLGGVGTILSLLPILAIFFALMGLLEDVGYMARAAYVMDRLMHAIGLHGKSFLPLFLGFGCNVPAVLGSRIIDSPRDRLLTIMLTPLVPCAGRLALLPMLVPAFFPENATLVSTCLVALPLLVLALVGMVGKHLLRSDEESAFIMEMPLYHRPNARTIGIFVWTRLLSFIQKAATLILAVSIVVWVLSFLPNGDVESSILAGIGRVLEPIGAPMGLDWRALVALLTSFVAKENSIATLGVLYHVAEGGSLAQSLSAHMSTASGLAFLVAEMLFIPCVATVAAIKQETASLKWTLLNLLLLGVLSFTGGTLAYHVARLFFG